MLTHENRFYDPSSVSDGESAVQVSMTYCFLDAIKFELVTYPLTHGSFFGFFQSFLEYLDSSRCFTQ